VGLDPATDWLPVAPAAHYLCGGVVADLDGASSLPGLWVAGEAACNGVHGANRLASNSLLDGMVFGPRVVEAVGEGRDGPRPTGAMRAVLDGGPAGGVPGRRLDLPAPLPGGNGAVDAGTAPPVAAERSALQRALTADAGVLRSDASLAAAAGAASRGGAVADAALAAPDASPADLAAAHELRNLATVAGALARAARARTESRGAHARRDFPDLDPGLQVRLVAGA
jgi:L-aspartate oxidase